MMKEVKKNKEEGKVQILLFSATFDEAVKKYAHDVVGGQANQVRSCTMLALACLKHACLCKSQPCIILLCSMSTSNVTNIRVFMLLGGTKNTFVEAERVITSKCFD